jgi:hypothetical protein
MADKARLYDVQLKDGHGIWTAKIAGPSGAQVRSNLSLSPHVDVVSVKSANWHKFFAQPNEEGDGVDFISEDGTLRVSRNDLGHNYLLDQYPQQVTEVMKYLNDN